MMWKMMGPTRWYASILIALLCAGCAAPADVTVIPTQVATPSAVAPATAQVVPEATLVEATPGEPEADPTTLVPTSSAVVPTLEATTTASVAATTVVTSDLRVSASGSFAQPLAELGEAFGGVAIGTAVVAGYDEAVESGQELATDTDVVITNDPTSVDALVAAGRAVSETARTIALDRLVVVVPSPENAIVRTFQDMGRVGVRVVAATNDVPAGAAAKTMIERVVTDSAYGDAFKNALQANMVANEPDTASVLRKVVLGEADAGILYSSEIVDVLAERTGRISIPDALNTVRTMTVVPITGSNGAEPFVDYLFTPPAQEILARYGYEPAGGTLDMAAPEGVLEITGKVASTLTLTRDDLEQYPQIDVPAEVTGGAQGYRGPRLADLLSEAGASTAAQTVVFVGADGTTSERPLEELLGRFDVLVALLDDGGLQIIDPRLDEPVAFDNVVRIEVK